MNARRCCLSIPARPRRRLEKAAELIADEVVIDLEDSVPAGEKAGAREDVVEALARGRFAAPSVAVRVNAVGSEWFEEDLRAVGAAGSRLGSVVVPKVESADDLLSVQSLLDEVGEPGSVGLQALIESARGLRDVNEISIATPRLQALIVGPADMSVALGFPSPEEGPRWDFVRGAVLVAARAAGIQAIDGPFLQISDTDGLHASAHRGRDFGFDGKWAIHPAQVEPLTLIFAPTEGETEHARAILDALAEAGDGSGAVMLDGEMLDEASRKRAEAVLARAGAGPSAGAASAQ